MGEKVPNRDPLFSIPAEVRNELRHRIVETDSPLLHEHHDARRRGDNLRQGREVEDGVCRHRLGARKDGAVPERLLVKNRVTAADQDDGARQFVA
jgi:hypothetical protein